MSTLTNLIAYWRMDEASGTRFDSVGAMNLAQSGSVGSGPGKLGAKCASLGTASVGMQASGESIGSTTDVAITIAGWYRIDSVSGASEKPIVLLEVDDDVGSFITLQVGYDHSTGKVFAQTAAETLTADSFGALSVGVWYHIIAIWNGTSVNLFVNNVGDYSATHTDRDGHWWLSQVAFGNSSTGHAFSVDEWGVWDEGISPTDRSDLYNSGTGAVPPGLGSPAGSNNQAAFFAFHGF